MSRFFPPSGFSWVGPLAPVVVSGALAAGVAACQRLRVRGEGLVLDDAIHVGHLPMVNAGKPLWELVLLPHWQEHPGDVLWRPIAKILWAQTGSEPFLLALVTVVLTGLCTALFTWFLVARCRIPPWVGCAAGLLPVCHPLAADVLLPWVGQMDLMAAAWLLATLALLTHRSHGVALAGTGCFALALLCKESVLPALIAMPLAVAAVAPSHREALRRGGRALVLLGVVIGAWFATRAWLFAGAEGALGSGGGWYQEGERRLSSLELLGRYFAAFLDPRTPQTDYSFLKQPGTSAGIFPILGALGLGVLVVLGWWGFREQRGERNESRKEADRRRRYRIVAAAVWIVVFLMPYLQFVPIGALWAGRFAFLSLFGVGWLIAEGIAILKGRWREVATVALVVALVGGAVQINRRAPDWSDPLTMWTSEIRRQPTHAFAWSNLGVNLQYADDTTSALEAARHATELFPTYGESWLTRGRLERAAGDHAAGRQSYYRAEDLLGDHLDLHMEIARLDASEGHFEIAIARLEALAHKGAGIEEYEELIARVRLDLESSTSGVTNHQSNVEFPPGMSP